MSIIRATLIICITALLSILAVTLYRYNQERFEIIPQGEGIFVFDHRSSALNYCTSKGCKLISAEFMFPGLVPVVVPSPVAPMALPPQQLVNPNFTMMSPNKQQGQPETGGMPSPHTAPNRMTREVEADNRMTDVPREFSSSHRSYAHRPTQSAPNNFNTDGNDQGTSDDNAQDNSTQDDTNNQDNGDQGGEGQ